MTAPSGTIPVVVISGFLGSGKTTLIRALLSDDRVRDAALIVNEYGETGIDHHLFRKTDERTTLLRDGCVCCSLRDDLSEAMRELVDLRDRGEIRPFTRLIIETTGLADPGPILHTIISEPVLKNRYHIDRVLTTVDAVSGLTSLARYGEAIRQVAAADLVALTKLDLATPDATSALRREIETLNPVARVVDAPHGRFDIDLLFSDPAIDAIERRSKPVDSDASNPASLHAQAGAVLSHTLTFDTPLDWQMFGIWLTMLLHSHGAQVLRMKGLLNVGAERGPLLLEGVQHVMHAPRHLAAWPDDDRRSRLVFIVRGLEQEVLRDSLFAFQEASRRTVDGGRWTVDGGRWTE